MCHKFNWEIISKNVDLKQVARASNSFPWNWYKLSENHAVSYLAKNGLLYDDVIIRIKNRTKAAYILDETDLSTDMQRHIVEQFL